MRFTLLFSIATFFSFSIFAQTSGGPDAYGYTWKNSNHSSSPPVFNWIDIVSTGTQVTGLLDDNTAGPFTTSNGFQFYWYSTPSFYIGSNGYISFAGDNIGSPFPTSIPLTSGFNDWLAPMMSDLNFDGSGNPGTCYYWSNTDTLIVSFIEVPFWDLSGNGYTGANTFQVILDKNDFSITYNYLETGLGVKTTIDNAVGIENVTGTLGLSVAIDSLPEDSSTVKFYYPPVVTYSAIDGGVNWGLNDASGGVFVKANAPEMPISSNVKNFGNTNLSAFTVTDSIYNNSGTVVASGNASVSSLASGATTTVQFSDSFSAPSAGIYSMNTYVSGITGDIVAANDQLEVDVIAVDTTANTIWLDYSDGVPDGTGLGWNGGNGGIGVYIEPPIYPAKITRTRFYHTANASSAGFHALIFDDDGPPGQRGTLLDSVFVPGSTVNLNQYEVVQLDSTVVIDSGGIYLVWQMDGAGINLGRDITKPISRRTYEILGAGWSGYRDKLTEDFLMGIRVQYAYPDADFSTVNTLDPEISFFDMSTRNPTDWYWEFGDGDTSTQMNPVHTYQYNGAYNVCLTASNKWGSDSVCKTVHVEAIEAVAKFVYDASNLPTVVFTDSSSGPPTAWSWDFDDGGGTDTATIQHPTYTFKNTGMHNVCLTVSNANGISNPYCDSIAFAVGINENQIINLKCYPNPTSGNTTIELPISFQGTQVSVRIMDMKGSVVPAEFELNQLQLDLKTQNLNPGSYTIELLTDSGKAARISLQVK